MNALFDLLKTHRPDLFDNKGDFKLSDFTAALKQADTTFSQETYRLDWRGKSYAKALVYDENRTLLCANHAHNETHQNSQNILIQGDNLAVLKHLREAYRKKIKMIYIDPPYNTGSDGFVYQDDRKYTPEQIAQITGEDIENAEYIHKFINSKASSHSAWLTFMYPRLKIARDLLKDDGVIFISIDDNEQAQLKLLCDEIFGEGNFLTTISVKLSEATGVKMAHAKKRIPKLKEYIVCFKKSNDIAITPVMENKPEWDDEYRTVILGINKDELEKIKLIADDENRSERDIKEVNKILSKCSFQNAKQICKDETGKEITSEWLFDNAYRIVQFVTMTGGALQQAKEIKQSGNISGEAFSIITPKNKMYFIKTDFNQESDLPRSKILFADEYLQMNMGDFWQDIKTTGLDNEGDVPFKNGKKPLKLIKRLINLATQENDLILDFFAGSGTTAHAVMQLNAEDNGNRKFICVQLDEPVKDKSEAQKAGFNTIFEITKARIQKSIEKIKKENPDFNGDLGFKEYKIVPVPDNFGVLANNPAHGLTLLENLQLSDTDCQNILTTWCVQDGMPLHHTPNVVDLGGYVAYHYGTVLYLLDKGFDTPHLASILRRLDDTADDFNIDKIVILEPHFDSIAKRELSEAIGQYKPRKGNKLYLVVRNRADKG
ncbi:MAG: DNA methyltransferase [Moraxella sp.]|nr:DNA methyltransferase [Moraxella sp.]